MKIRNLLIVAFATMLSLNTTAQARHRHHSVHNHHYDRIASIQRNACGSIVDDRYPCQPNVQNAPMGRKIRTSPVNGYDVASAGGRSGSCLKFSKTRHLWCGCGTADYVGLDNSDGHWNLAANYRELPPAYPGAGKVAWRYGHVKVITGGSPGNWTCYDPNSGGGVAHSGPCSLAGFHVVDPNGNRVASNEGYSARRRHRYASR